MHCKCSRESPVLCHEVKMAQRGAAPSAWVPEWKDMPVTVGHSQDTVNPDSGTRICSLHMNFPPARNLCSYLSWLLLPHTGSTLSPQESRFYKAENFSTLFSNGATASRIMPGTEQVLNKYRLTANYYGWQTLATTQHPIFSFYHILKTLKTKIGLFYGNLQETKEFYVTESTSVCN